MNKIFILTPSGFVVIKWVVFEVNFKVHTPPLKVINAQSILQSSRLI